MTTGSDSSPSIDLGALGEDQFQAWCTAAGITPTRVTSDKHGWDFVIQVPVDGARRALAQGEPDAPTRTCKVQVKTTSPGERLPQVKLSNWAVMARELMPWFIVHIEFSGRTLHRVRLAHVGKTLVELAIEKVFRAEAEQRELHKSKWSPGPEHFRAIEGDVPCALLRAVRDAIGRSEADYVKEKVQWKDSAGYGADRFTFSFVDTATDLSSARAELAKWVTGEKRSLPVASATLHETRFGVKTLVRSSEGDVRLEIPTTPSIGKSRLALVCSKRGELVEHICETHSAAAVLPFLDDNTARVRWVSRSLEVIVAPSAHGHEVTLSVQRLDPFEAEAIDELARAARTLLLVSRAAVDGLSLELHLPSGVHVSLDVSGVSHVKPTVLDEQIAMVVAGVGQLCRALDLPMNIQVVPVDLMKDAESFAMLGAATSGRTGDVDLIFTVPELSPADVEGRKIAVLSLHELQIGSYFMSAVLAFEGTGASRGGEEIGIDGRRVRIVSKYVHVGKAADSAVLVRDCINERARLLAEGTEFAIVPPRVLKDFQRAEEASP